MSAYVLYILECCNGSYYTGITTDMARRWTAHCAGKAAKYTRAFPPKRIAAAWTIHGDRALAQSIEAKVKQLSRAEKALLIDAPEKVMTCVDPAIFQGCIDPFTVP